MPASARPTPAPALSGASALADLALFWVSGPMVLISPVQIHDALVRYSDRLFQRSPTIVCVPQTTGLDLAGAAAVDPAVVGAIVDAVGSQKCNLRPWGALPGIYDLLATLTRAGLDVDAHAFPLREDLLTVQQLDSRSVFEGS